VNSLSGFADISLLQLLLVAIVALFASIVGGLAGYGAGALMPLVLLPLIGAVEIPKRLLAKPLSSACPCRRSIAHVSAAPLQVDRAHALT
jgi:hypothetical protein